MEFYKYQGTGNDFVMIDNRNLQFPKNKALVEKLCDRRFGIGGDGLILLENHETADFKMVYFNSDGSESTMCGNGGRCIVAFAEFLGIIAGRTTFEAIDGTHEAYIRNGIVKLKMIDVDRIYEAADGHTLNTGSPHLVSWISDLQNFDVYNNGNKIRNSATYSREGINVNFAEQISEDEIAVRTYERGVEDETFSCGTGATAAALTFLKDKDAREVKVMVLGGNLKVYAEKDLVSFKNIWLEGPAEQVFKGEITVQ